MRMSFIHHGGYVTLSSNPSIIREVIPTAKLQKLKDLDFFMLLLEISSPSTPPEENEIIADQRTQLQQLLHPF